MPTPLISRFRRNNTHRLIPSQYSEDGDSVLNRLADDAGHLNEIFDLDRATNERDRAENGLTSGIGPDELVFGVPYFRTVNAAFTHPHPLGSRFNGWQRGAWYAGFELRTSQAEVAFHKTVEFAEINRFEQSVTYDDYLADFAGDFHDIRNPTDDSTASYSDCLAPGSYHASQSLSAQLIEQGAQGLIYPSVRRPGGTCLVCWRPALVYHVRRHARYRFTWSGSPTPRISVEKRFGELKK